MLVEHLFRRQAGQMLARLCRVFGLKHLDLAEEVVQDALVQALRQWPFRGIPDDPAAWLLRVASNRALDVLRRSTSLRRKLADLRDAATPQPAADPAALPWDGDLGDDQLAMTFACCHPALAEEIRVALTLKAVAGFGVAEVARAFLVPETTIAQRLVRAKRFLREANLALTIPPPPELPGRLDSVLRVLYLLFNEGYTAHRGEDLVRHDLCGEALRLAGLLAGRADTALPKVHALLSLFFFQVSRFPARVDEAGDLLLLAEQDRALWDRRAVHLGMRHLDQASEGDELTEYHVQAAIAAVHTVAPSYEQTDWARVLTLYDQLQAVAPSPVVALNRAVAVAMVHGADAGLAALEPLRGDAALRDYYLLPSVRADLLLRLGRDDDAAACYRDALASPCTEPERRFLQKRLERCARSVPS